MSFLNLLVSVAIALPASAHILGRESDSGIVGPPYAQLVSYFASLPKKYPEFIQVAQYGTTPKGRPMMMLKVSYPQRFVNARSSKAAILITGTTHGNEYLAIEDRLPEWFASEGVKDPVIMPFFQQGGTVYFIPIFNPDGYDARTRGNSKGADLNRDFTVRQANFEGFKHIETQGARDMLSSELRKQNQRLLITMDYHCCIGAALYPWSFKPSPQLPANHLAILKNYGTIMKNVFGASFPVGTTPDILGYNAIGTSKDFYYESFGAFSFTYEGEEDVEKNKLPQHIQMWRALIQYGQLTRGILR